MKQYYFLEYAGVDPEMDTSLNWKKSFETFLFYITLNSHGIRQSQCGNAATVLTDVNVNSYKLHFPFIRGLVKKFDLIHKNDKIKIWEVCLLQVAKFIHIQTLLNFNFTKNESRVCEWVTFWFFLYRFYSIISHSKKFKVPHKQYM